VNHQAGSRDLIDKRWSLDRRVLSTETNVDNDAPRNEGLVHPLYIRKLFSGWGREPVLCVPQRDS
jgi:hypothetical protein